MMSKYRTIPFKDFDFNIAQHAIATAASNHRAEWRLDGDWIDEALLPKKAAWDAAWEAYENPATRTILLTFAKKEARKAYEIPLRALVKILQSNPRVSHSELTAMGIAIPGAGKSLTPVASTPPFANVDTRVIRQLTLHFSDPESTSKAKPAGQRGADIRWAILDSPPVDIEELSGSAFSSHTPLTLSFEERQRGKTVYFCLCWENTRGQKGPWSEIKNAIIP